MSASLLPAQQTRSGGRIQPECSVYPESEIGRESCLVYSRQAAFADSTAPKKSGRSRQDARVDCVVPSAGAGGCSCLITHLQSALRPGAFALKIRSTVVFASRLRNPGARANSVATYKVFSLNRKPGNACHPTRSRVLTYLSVSIWRISSESRDRRSATSWEEYYL